MQSILYYTSKVVSSILKLFSSGFHGMSFQRRLNYSCAAAAASTHLLMARLQMTFWCGSHTEGTEGGGTVLPILWHVCMLI